jgi:hypothetical protein
LQQVKDFRWEAHFLVGFPTGLIIIRVVAQQEVETMKTKLTRSQIIALIRRAELSTYRGGK